MLLEAGLKRSNDDKAARRWGPGGILGNATTYVSYEAWVKRIGFLFFSVWFVFALYYVSSSSTGSSATMDADADAAMNANTMGTYENAFPEETNFIVIGDFGTGSADQVKTSETLKHFAAALDPKPAFVLSTGDQIYEHGISSSSDPVLKTRFEKMYDHPDLNVPWYITIGNHDCEGSIDAMLAYAGLKDSKWYFPQRYYSIDRPVAPKTILRIVVVDACDLVCGHEPRNFRCHEPMNVQTSEVTRLEQYRWIDDVLSAGKPEGVDHMWTIVVGHWGIYSYAGNAHTKELIDSLDPLLNKHNVHAYFNGHDHCMQHIKRLDPSSGRARNYFVSGAGGYPVHTLMPKARANADLVHAAMTHGFMWVKVTKTLFQVQFIDKAGEILYTTEVQY